MPEIVKRYQLIMLGHAEQIIQERLDKIAGTIVGVVSVGVNVMAIVDRAELPPIKKVK